MHRLAMKKFSLGVNRVLPLQKRWKAWKSIPKEPERRAKESLILKWSLICLCGDHMPPQPVLAEHICESEGP